MGELIKVTCPRCGQEWKCRRGHGKNHARLEVVCESFSENTQIQIKQLLVKNPFPLFQFDYRPIVCQDCKVVDSVPVLKMPKEQASFVGDCARCGKEVALELLEKPLECPICQAEVMEVQRIGFWD